MMKKLFKTFNELNERITDNEIDEISIKQPQIQFTFLNGKILSIKDILAIESHVNYTIATDVTTYDDSIILTFRDLENSQENIDKPDNKFKPFLQLINALAEKVCTCPSLEVTITKNYIKFYIDKPNIQLDALQEVDKIIGAKSQLELTGPRPYLLYVKDYEDWNKGETNDKLDQYQNWPWFCYKNHRRYRLWGSKTRRQWR